MTLLLSYSLTMLQDLVAQGLTLVVGCFCPGRELHGFKMSGASAGHLTCLGRAPALELRSLRLKESGLSTLWAIDLPDNPGVPGRGSL